MEQSKDKEAEQKETSKQTGSSSSSSSSSPRSFKELLLLAKAAFTPSDVTLGPASTHTDTRLFDAPEGTVPDVTLYRDKHYWCPYCEKTELWLHARRVPFQIRKVSMFCYGDKEAWYKRIVPSGMLPALQLTQGGPVITESDDILAALEHKYGPAGGQSMGDPKVLVHRRLERKLFGAWCDWLCRKSRMPRALDGRETAFAKVARNVEDGIVGPFMLGKTFGTADVVYIPYLERMNASLFYYKGYDMRKEHPKIGAWFSALEGLEDYRGLLSDFSTHAHDLPPQMGACYPSGDEAANAAAALVDNGPYTAGLLGKQLDPNAFPEPEDSVGEAAWRVLKHSETLMRINPHGTEAAEEGLRAVLTAMLTGDVTKSSSPPKDVDAALRYIKDRVSVPRDMPIWSAMRFRDACEVTAARYGSAQSKTMGLRDRRDQHPAPFAEAYKARQEASAQ